MNIVWAVLIVAVATAAGVAVMLAVRRRAPAGSYFADGDRAAGIFGVVATGFSVLLGFLIFLGFESYDASRTGAETEALTVGQQMQTAQFLPADAGADLTGELVCYARSVIGVEWVAMEDGSLDEEINPWGVAMFATLQGVELGSPNQEAAYAKWLDQTSTREEARQDRIHGAAGLMPTPLWLALFFISAVVFALILGFADSGERVGASDVHGRRRRRDRHPAAAARLLGRSVSGRCRQPRADSDEAHDSRDRSAARRDWP